MTQTFRSRDEQVEALQIKLAGSPIAFGGAAIALEHILEAEARGAAEERGKDAEIAKLRSALTRICDGVTPRTAISMRKIARAALTREGGE